MTNPAEVPPPPPHLPGPLAEWADRAVALVLDAVLVIVAGLVIALLGWIVGLVSDALGVVVSILGYLVMSVYGLYLGYLEGEKGQSPGKALRGLKVVKVADGQLLGGGMGVVRKIAHALDSLICLLGWFLPLFDPQKQTIADKVVQSVVVKNQEVRPLNQEIFLP